MMMPPRLVTARARPCTSFSGWIAAQCGVKAPASMPRALMRARAVGASSSAQSASVAPQARCSLTSSRRFATCPALRENRIVPPCAKSQSIDSSAAQLPRSSTARYIACCIAIARSRPASRAIFDRAVGNSADAQPPLRPLAPNPTRVRSSTTTFELGDCRRRCSAVQRPVYPAPMMTTSAWFGSGRRSSSTGCPAVSRQSECGAGSAPCAVIATPARAAATGERKCLRRGRRRGSVHRTMW